MYLDILIQSASKRDALVHKIKADGDELRLGSTSIRCRSLLVDDLVSLETQDVDAAAIQEELETWLAPFEPGAVISGLADSEDTINLIKSEEAPTSTVLEALAAVSSRARHSLAVRNLAPDELDEPEEEPGRALVDYLEEHRVDPDEVFRGITMLQFCLDYEIEAAIKHFIDVEAIPGDHPLPLLFAIVVFEELGARYLAKRIAQGEDPARRDEGGYGLLHSLACSSRDTEMTRYLLELGLDPNQVTDEGESPLLLAVQYLFDDDEWDGDLDEYEEAFAYLELLRSFGARADTLSHAGSGVLIHVEGSEKLTTWFRDHFPELEETKASRWTEGAIREKYGVEEGTFDFYERCLEKGVLAPFERPAFAALFEVGRNAEAGRKNTVVSRARRIHALACEHDQPFLLEKLETWGFPLLLRTQVEMSELLSERDYDANTIALAHQREATKTIAYLEQQGLTLGRYEQIKSSFVDWCQFAMDQPENLGTVQKCCSEAWIDWATGKWERRGQKSSSLERSLVKAFRAWVNNRETERAFDWVHVTDRLLFNQGGMIKVGDGYQLATLEEVLAELGLED
ncbi:MAG: ankyrin repeat domain-containing protein [Acidobacteriota bacterium]